MHIIIDIFLILFSLGLLIIGAELLMKGGVIIAKNKNISELVIASTLIAFGTGLPTIAVNIALLLLVPNGESAVMGNALGTNFVNIGLGLGIPAFMLKIVTKYEAFEKEIPIFLGITGLMTGFAIDGTISRLEGILLFLSYLVTLFIVYQYSLREKLEIVDEEQMDFDTNTISTNKVEGKSNTLALYSILGGLLTLIFFSVNLALLTPRLSLDFNISQYVLGLTVLGIGTSLPIIVTSIKSSLNGDTDIILGNVFGGTIANIGLGIAIPAVISSIIVDKEATSDIYYFNILSMIVIFGTLIEMKLLGNNKVINKISGLIIVLFYVVYLLAKFI